MGNIKLATVATKSRAGDVFDFFFKDFSQSQTPLLTVETHMLGIDPGYIASMHKPLH